MANTKTKKGLEFQRKFTIEGVSPFDQFEYDYRDSVIKNPNGEKVFEMTNVEVPKQWSQIATDILAQKYFRKAGVPQADGSLGRETTVKQVAHRMANCWRVWGERYGYFTTTNDAQVFYEELVYSILNQACVPNSPQWFNTGLHESYGITGGAQGHYYVDPTDKQLKRSTSAYERPQPHACFILSVSDDLVNEGGIMDLWTREARIFKYGSGVGTNFSHIRGANEKLSGGGSSSGLMSFLKIGDRAAGAIKSGGTTRRAAKMVCLDLDHPEVLEFINWKVQEEDKVAALIAAGYDNGYEGEAYATVSGQNSNNSVRIPNSFFKALSEDGNWELKARTDGRVMKSVPAREVWEQIANAAWRCADPGTQYDTTINEWHTCPKGGRINASNPCSEYMFLDNTACNLASINLRKFFNESDNSFDVEGFEYILWHTGNTDENTAGCLLLGDTQTSNLVAKDGFIGSSTVAYKKMYAKVAGQLLQGKKVSIEYLNISKLSAQSKSAAKPCRWSELIAPFTFLFTNVERNPLFTFIGFPYISRKGSRTFVTNFCKLSNCCLFGTLSNPVLVWISSANVKCLLISFILSYPF